MDYEILSRMKGARLIPVSINADGTEAKSQALVTSVKNSTGDYTLTIKPGFQVAPYFFGSARKDGIARHILQVPEAGIATNSLNIKSYNLSDVASDSPFDGFILGSAGRTPTYGVVENEVKCPMNAARMLFFHYNGTTPAQQAGLNPFEGTFTKQGTGLYTLTLRRPFFATPYVVIQSTSTTRLVEVATKDYKTITIEAVNSSSGAAADAEFLVMVMGQRARTENLKQFYPLRCPHAFTYFNPFEYDGATNAMIRGGAYISASEVSTAYTFVSNKKNQRSSYGLAIGSGAAILTGVNTRTTSGFNIDVESDSRVYGLEIAMRRGRYW